jgi:5'-deoxynucleotidase YfbR-like HD superfamily hydrolase
MGMAEQSGAPAINPQFDRAMRDIQFAQAIREGGLSQRCHTLPTLSDASNAKHQWGMIALLIVLWPEARREMLVSIALHDIAERWVGDTPADAKYGIDPALGKAVRAAEVKVEDALGISPLLNCLTDEEKSWHKGLDMLEFLMFCGDERALGNRNYEQAERNVRAMLNSPWVPERIRSFAQWYTWRRTSGMVPGEVMNELDSSNR